MEMLKVSGKKIVNPKGEEICLRGCCIGGWMNMENFINGYTGSETGLRTAFSNVLGGKRASFFFDRLLDHFFGEDDIRFLKNQGANVVRLPLNYRHFEEDTEPFKYKEKGFKRLETIVDLCSRYGIYVILDLHAVAGWQNSEWHSDNANRISLLWNNPHYQDRLIKLWEELARRYAGNATVAGYNLINEPCSGAPYGEFDVHYIQPDYPAINQMYRRLVAAVRIIDPEHIIFLEGDNYAKAFDGLEKPFDENLVYSSHNYTGAGFGPGKYPGTFGGKFCDGDIQEELFLAHEGTVFTRNNGVPLWVGEFGSAYNGPADEIPDRLNAMDDQLAVFNKYKISWTTWTYKDVGVMGLTQLDPESEYLNIIHPILKAKEELSTDLWMAWLPKTRSRELTEELAGLILEHAPHAREGCHWVKTFLGQAALSGFAASLLQPTMAGLFRGMSESRLDEVLQSFSFGRCRINKGLAEILNRRFND